MEKAYKQLTATVFLLLLCGSVSAKQNYWVLGSFSSRDNAQSQQSALQSSLGVNVLTREASVNGRTVYRVLVAEHDASSVELPSGIGSPWLITIYDDVATENAIVVPSPARKSEQVFFLVGQFADIDEALALERKLAEAALPVRGEAILVEGHVLHQVWIGPSTPTTSLATRIKALGLNPINTKLATRDESNVSKELSQVQVTRAKKQEPAPAEKPVRSNKYPKDYNLARLPEKRTTPIVKPK